MTENQRTIINSISEEIDKQARSCAAEQYSPGHDADASDEFIAERKRNVGKLRQIRENLEDLFIGWLP